jgi:hypothetical protein
MAEYEFPPPGEGEGEQRRARERYRGGEPPLPCPMAREVQVWDTGDKRWEAARRADLVQLQDLVTITWSNTGANTDVAPDIDLEIDITWATRIAIQIDSTSDDNTSTSFDVNVESSLDGTHWDTSPYAEANVGNDTVKTFLVNPGPARMRLRGDNNAGATTGYITARVLVLE